MNKFTQCIYTLLLIITCLVASPLIYKQIWTTSSEKTAETAAPPPEIHRSASITTTAPPAPSGMQETVPEATETTAAEKDAETVTSSGTETTETVTTTEAPTEPPTEPGPVDASYFDDALFIGDSRTVGIRDYGTLKNAYYYCNVGLSAGGIASSSVDGKSINTVLSERTYGKIYVMLGINEVGNDYEYTLNAFRNLLDTIRSAQPDAIVYLEANLHVTEKAQTSVISNERINVLNEGIAALADGIHVFYIDVNPTFDDEKGNLRSDCTNDGVHVLAEYYQMWCDWFCINTVIPPEEPTEPSTEETTEAPTEETTDTPTEETTEAPTEETTEAPTEETTEAPTEDTTEASTEDTTEASSESVTEAHSDDTTTEPPTDTTSGTQPESSTSAETTTDAAAALSGVNA